MQFLILFGFILLVLKSIGISNIEEIRDNEMECSPTIIRICAIAQEILQYIGYAIIAIGIIVMTLL